MPGLVELSKRANGWTHYQLLGLEETVHDIDDGHNSSEVIPPLPEKTQVLCKEDIIGQPASIVYHSCLKQLAQYLVVPIPKCNTKDPVTDAECGALRPFEVKITSRGTISCRGMDMSSGSQCLEVELLAHSKIRDACR
ncbi:unnamed protein product [Arctogadus glacialis]